MTTTATKPTRELIEASIARAKREIIENLCEWGEQRPDRTRPWPIASFADLHEWCDANTLGGLCDDQWCVDDDGLADGWMSGANEVQDTIDTWIRAGGLHEATIRVTAAHAEFEFWQLVAARFPTATTGDLGHIATRTFEEQCRAVVGAWMRANVPGFATLDGTVAP